MTDTPDTTRGAYESGDGVRDLVNVRVLPGEGHVTPLTPDEERRARATLFADLGTVIADRGWVRFPAYSPEERRRLVDVARMLTDHWGVPVTAEAPDACALRLSLPGHGVRDGVVRPER